MTLQLLTEDVLKIFWTVEEKSASGCYRKYQEEADGILLYGYWNQLFTNESNFPLHLWPDGTLAKKYLYQDKGWTIVEWTVRVAQWPTPSAWCNTLEGSMRTLCQQGALVAWCGNEGFFEYPTNLFLSEASQSGIYAGYSSRYGMMCSAFLKKPYSELDSQSLLDLRTAI